MERSALFQRLGEAEQLSLQTATQQVVLAVLEDKEALSSLREYGHKLALDEPKVEDILVQARENLTYKFKTTPVALTRAIKTAAADVVLAMDSIDKSTTIADVLKRRTEKK